ncbi:Uncharacterised protein [Lysinibacillus sphaericus]|uniref:Uncharacterized protein n=1 Tax=Lysinibacillus sphaericus TaxID=1421 RepID=A0AAJ4ZWD4_LYSSH|nr:Uncharacterised protein [Lysinibacillus sphaericus]
MKAKLTGSKHIDVQPLSVLILNGCFLNKLEYYAE